MREPQLLMSFRSVQQDYHVRGLPATDLQGECAPAADDLVILMRRDLQEVLASQKAMLERSGKQGGNLSDDKMAALYSGQLSQIVDWL